MKEWSNFSLILASQQAYQSFTPALKSHLTHCPLMSKSSNLNPCQISDIDKSQLTLRSDLWLDFSMRKLLKPSSKHWSQDLTERRGVLAGIWKNIQYKVCGMTVIYELGTWYKSKFPSPIDISQSFHVYLLHFSGFTVWYN